MSQNSEDRDQLDNLLERMETIDSTFEEIKNLLMVNVSMIPPSFCNLALIPESLEDAMHVAARLHHNAEEISGLASKVFGRCVKLVVEADYLLRTGGRDENDYDLKRETVKRLNTYIRLYRMAFHVNKYELYDCQESEHLLLAVASPDKKGRYILENRDTKKRILASRTLHNIFSNTWIRPARPRKEGLANSKDDN